MHAVFIINLHCNPAQDTFDARVPGKCLSDTAIVCNLLTWALPITTVWRLHLPVVNKIALTLLFDPGLVSCLSQSVPHQAMIDKLPSSVVVIGIVRIATVYKIDYRDFPYSGTTASDWAFRRRRHRHNDGLQSQNANMLP